MYWFSRVDKKERATINPKIDADRCFQYAPSVALVYGKIKWNQASFSIFKLFINDYIWEETKYPS